MKRILLLGALAVLGTAAHAAVTVITDFESYANNTAALFRDPNFSGSTDGNVKDANQRSAVLTGGAGGNTTNVLSVAYDLEGAEAWRWVRLTTFGAANLPNPRLDLNQYLKIDIWANQNMSIALGIRETGTSGAIGSNGGTTGTIEWTPAGAVRQIGETSGSIAGPTGVALAANTWTTLTFKLKGASARGFTGNGVLDGDWGVLEHLALMSDTGSADRYQIYIDNVRQDTVPEPATLLALGAGLAAIAAKRRRKS